MFQGFDKRFAYGFQGGNSGGWTPPWLQEENEWGGRGPRHGRGPWGRHFGHGPHEHGHEHGHGPQHFHGHWGPRGPWFFGMRRRGPFGPGGPFGPQGPFDPEGSMGPQGLPGRGRRFFGRGDMKFALLNLLQERPMHGYEMMKALEEKSGGFYAPSAGSVYPTLQMLEDRGLVTASEVEGKKVYTITDTGRAALNERQGAEGQGEEFAGPPWARGHRGHHHGGPRGNFPEMQALRSEAGEVARLFAIAGRQSINNAQQLTQLRGIIERTRKELSDLIYSASTPTTPNAQGQDAQGTPAQAKPEQPNIEQA